LLIPEISTEREFQYEEDPSKSQFQTLHILEYEEFNGNEDIQSPIIKSPTVIDKEKSNKHTLKVETSELLQEEKINKAGNYKEK